ncbi:MAG: HAD-IC family P-type ATPase [Candidatus Dojkabacteria bacterium]|nr:HAD-IC family P-type ATPase [Candidatus Dojkabacteria bacterium]
MSYYKQSLGKTFRIFKSSEDGLSSNESMIRLKTYGPNKIKAKKKTSPFIIFIHQFKSPLVYILVAAGLISLLLGDSLDAMIISFAIFVDVIVGFIQEYRASNTLETLLGQTVFHTTVIRDGRKHLISVGEIVPGDVLIVNTGDKVPADLKIIESKNLEVDESALTGESHPQKKSTGIISGYRILAERTNMLYAGTNVVNGSCKALVVQTGNNTELGKITAMVHAHIEEKTLIQKEIERLSKFIGFSLVTVIGIIFAIGMIRTHDLAEMFTESVALAVSALPEGLPVSITIIFAIGMQKILKRKGLIRNLLGTETLGRTEVLCIDKTGTLTKGKMNVNKLVFADKTVEVDGMAVLESHNTFEILKAAAICTQAFQEETNSETKYRGNPTDIALLKFSNKFNVNIETIEKQNKVLDRFPFDPTKKLSAALLNTKGTNRLYIIGSPEKLIDRSEYISFYSNEIDHRKLKDNEFKNLHRKNETLSSKGYRVLGVAYKDTNKRTINQQNFQDLTFLGFAVISDPLRESAKEAVKQTQKAGLRLVIVTGDQEKTAVNIAGQVEIPHGKENIINGERLSKMSDSQLDSVIEKIHMFVRVSPHDKVRIVKSWQRRDKVVAMTGDGINDAPALHLADIGVALGSGTDVAKESADLVLMDDNLKTIINTVKEGRGILDNIKKVAIYLLSDSFAGIMVVGISIFLGLPLPILAAQILWVNLIEDGLPDIALSMEPLEKNLLNMPPKFFKKPIIDNEFKVFTILLGFFNGIVLVGLFLYYYYNSYDIEFIRTMVFGALTVDSLFLVYACKSLRRPIWKIDLLNNRFLNISFIIGVILFFSAVHLPLLQKLLQTVPLSLNHWLLLFGIGMIDLIALEITKEIFIFRRAHENKPNS